MLMLPSPYMCSLQFSALKFVRRAGATSWEDFALVGEQREKVKESLHNTLGELAKLFLRDTSGPFLLGKS